MDFRDWMLRHREQIQQHIAKGGTLADLLQVDAQGNAIDPFSGGRITGATPAAIKGLESAFGATTGQGITNLPPTRLFPKVGGGEGMANGVLPPGAGQGVPPKRQGGGGAPGAVQWEGEYGSGHQFIPGADWTGIEYQGGGNPQDIARFSEMLDWMNSAGREMQGYDAQNMREQLAEKAAARKQEQGRQKVLDRKFTDIIGIDPVTGKATGASFDPDNPNAFSSIAADVQGISGDLQRQLDEIDQDPNIDPASKLRLKEVVKNQGRAQKAGVRQGQIADQWAQERGDMERYGAKQAPGMTGQGAMVGQAAGLQESDLGRQQARDLSIYGQQNAANMWGRGLGYQAAVGDRDFGYRQNRDTIGDSQWEKEYQMRKAQQEWERKQQSRGGGFGSIFGKLLGMVPGGDLVKSGIGFLKGLGKKSSPGASSPSSTPSSGSTGRF